MCGAPLCLHKRELPKMRSAQTLARLGYYEKIYLICFVIRKSYLFLDCI